MKKICFFIGLLIGLGACKHPISLVPPIDYYAKYSIPYVLDTTTGTRPYCGFGELVQDDVDTNYPDFYIYHGFFNKTNPYEVYLSARVKKTGVEGLWSFNFKTGSLNLLHEKHWGADININNELVVISQKGICTMDNAGNQLTQIAPIGSYNYIVRWSPNGQKIVYYDNSNQMLCVRDKKGKLLDTLYNNRDELINYHFTTNDELLLIKRPYMKDSMNLSLYRISTHKHKTLPFKNANIYSDISNTLQGSRFYTSSYFIKYFDWKTYEEEELPTVLKYYPRINIHDHTPKTGKALCKLERVYYPLRKCLVRHSFRVCIMNLDGSDVREIVIPAP
ncbi:MAG: hypothetical protein RL757_2090 [Bacteroidota bacterium]|jgi:hypothetical protein